MVDSDLENISKALPTALSKLCGCRLMSDTRLDYWSRGYEMRIGISSDVLNRADSQPCPKVAGHVMVEGRELCSMLVATNPRPSTGT